MTQPCSVARAKRNIAWIEANLFIPEGKDVTKPVRLRPWQKDILIGIYATPTRRAIISFSRKAGKTSLSAMILLLHLVGPEAAPNSQLYSAAQSRDQASLLFQLASKMVRMSPTLAGFVQIRDTAKQLLCPELGTIYRALSADASSNLGLGPKLVVHDELGQVRGPRSPLFEALETGSAAHENPLSICISTQAPTDADLFSVLIDDAKTGADPKVKLFLYTAPEELDPFSDEALKAANPAFGDFANAVELRAMAEDARRMPSREAEYRNLILNQRVEAQNPFITKAVWDLNAGAVADSFAGYPVYAGLDLAEVSDLCALVLVAKIADKWHVKTTCWLPLEGLSEKARKDRVPYDLWHQQGFLSATPGRAIEYSFVAAHLYDLFQKLDIRTLHFDRWNMRHLKPWLTEAGFNNHFLDRFVDFGQGYQSMSPALRDLETALLNANLCHGDNPIMTMCMANATVETDPAGNRKLSKKRSRGRIDAAVALTMAMAAAATAETKPVFQSIWEADGMLEQFSLITEQAIAP